MIYSVEDILGMPDHERRTLKLRKKPRRSYKKEVRDKLSRDEMLQFLRDNGIKTSRQLERVRKPNEPNVSDYRSEFGNWSDAITLAFGSKIAVDMDAEYVLKAVVEFELWTVSALKNARKKDPQVIPSWRKIINLWGSYSNLIECAKRYSLKGILMEYCKLSNKLGRIPTMKDVKNNGLVIDEAVRFYGTKSDMDDFVRKLRGGK